MSIAYFIFKEYNCIEGEFPLWKNPGLPNETCI